MPAAVGKQTALICNSEAVRQTDILRRCTNLNLYLALFNEAVHLRVEESHKADRKPEHQLPLLAGHKMDSAEASKFLHRRAMLA